MNYIVDDDTSKMVLGKIIIKVERDIGYNLDFNVLNVVRVI